MSWPCAAAPVMVTIVPWWTGSRAWAAVSRSQCRPSGDVQTTPVPSAGFWPAARYPVAVRISRCTWSPESVGVMPVVRASVQDRPSVLVQMASGPTASQPWGPAVTSCAGCPGAGSPPAAARTGATCQLVSASVETRNWARVTSPPVWRPTATTVPSELATWVSVWNTPGAPSAGLAWLAVNWPV